MCGIAGIVGPGASRRGVEAMVASQKHRGPDDGGTYVDRAGGAAFGHNRLSIIDLSAAGRQPMITADGSLVALLNGEIYNYLELREQLAGYPFRSRTDTEVALAAYELWGEECFERFVGMFALVIWDTRARRLVVARDRFGVKPVYLHERGDGTLYLASEIKAFHAVGIPAEPDATTWATYLAAGVTDHSERTFSKGIRSLAPGHLLVWEDGAAATRCWYDLAATTGQELDQRGEDEVGAEYRALLEESVSLRFRADVPVGINLSGGVDSSTLLGIVDALYGRQSDLTVFTFVTGDARYDELPWVRKMLDQTGHPLQVCKLDVGRVPDLALEIQEAEDEPYGGIPTLAYARLFEVAKEVGVTVLLDGQGLDEQWAGYDYYAAALRGKTAGVVQGSTTRPVRPECLTPEFRALAEPLDVPKPFGDALRDLQYRDARHTKIPRALRFNDRISMRMSRELREPFLDHRLFELALRQPPDRKIDGGTHKRMLREVARSLLPGGLVEAPKRPLQTPQREWLRGPLRPWATDSIEAAIGRWGGVWLDGRAVRREWRAFLDGQSDNSFYVWQWISAALDGEVLDGRRAAARATACAVRV
jgi:asparagine synthase (glutamine-hydrolysing)